MKILEICPFSAGICGVWSRVKQESIELSKKGHEVYVFSSNIEKGTNKIISLHEEIQGIKIRRFSAKNSLFSKNIKNFNFEVELIKLNPDIVITHVIHPNSLKALEICINKRIPCYLVTHAPFNVKRKLILSWLTNIYYAIKVKPKINKFIKIIAITNWEEPYLLNLGVSKDKIVYIPNGIPNEFFSQKKSQENDKVLFLGRITPIKNLEILISVARQFPKINFSIVGVAESKYLKKINNLKPKNVKIYSPIYDTKEKIKLIDEHKIFILPSKREAMPQSLIEAMARGKIVISSDTDGGKEIIKNDQNGFLFKIGNKQDLKNKIQTILTMKLSELSKIRENTKNSVKDFKWDNLILKLETILK